MLTRELLVRLPKAELHVHLDSALRPATMVELAREARFTLPTTEPDELRRFMLVRDASSLEDYLAPRCGHIDRHNPCYCEGRLTLALETGFVKLPPHTADVPAAAYNDEPEHRDIAELYRTLPPVALTPAQQAELLAAALSARPDAGAAAS